MKIAKCSPDQRTCDGYTYLPIIDPDRRVEIDART